jgi:hypothetical protein
VSYFGCPSIAHNIKRITTKNGPLKTCKEVEEAWEKAWTDLEQSKIQAWIERIKPHVDMVLELEAAISRSNAQVWEIEAQHG